MLSVGNTKSGCITQATQKDSSIPCRNMQEIAVSSITPNGKTQETAFPASLRTERLRKQRFQHHSERKDARNSVSSIAPNGKTQETAFPASLRTGRLRKQRFHSKISQKSLLTDDIAAADAERDRRYSGYKKAAKITVSRGGVRTLVGSFAYHQFLGHNLLVYPRVAADAFQQQVACGGSE